MTELWRKSVCETAHLVLSREVSAREVTESTLARLENTNPKINAIVDEMPDEALAAADAIDKQLSAGEHPGPLAGVPVTIKVNVDQAGYPTTNGLRIQKDLIAEHDSPAVSNLKRAGAIVIGRTNTPAFSLRWFCRNSLHGHTQNPHNKAITPGGSSGGAAAATAAGIGAIGHGTDIGGSVRYPAYACGIHGLRPTLGRIPAYNPSSPDRHIGGQIMAVSGPLARTIADVEVGLQAMAAEDLRDPWWVPVDPHVPPQAKRACLALEPDGMSVDSDIKEALKAAAGAMEAAGWTIEEVPCPGFREPARLQAKLWLAEFRRTGAEAVHREADPDAAFVYAQMDRLCDDIDVNGLLDVLQRRMQLTRDWQSFLNRYPVMLCPVSGEVPFDDLADVESPERFDEVMEAQLLQVGLPLMGLPGLTVSTGMTSDNRPMGVQLIAGRYREDTLLDAGRVIEAASNPPGIAEPQ